MRTPRTAQLPMAFTAWEFIRGALLTYVYFLPLTIVPFTIMFSGGLFHPNAIGDIEVTEGVLALWAFLLLPSATWGLAALVPAALVALSLGLALRLQARRVIHLLTHAAWGLIVGLVVATLVLVGWRVAEADLAELLPTVLGYGVAVALAAALGWWTTASLALRRDARIAVTAQEAPAA